MSPRRVLLAVIDLDGGAGVFCRNLAAALGRHADGAFAVALLALRQRGLRAEDRHLFHPIEVLGSDIRAGWARALDVVKHARAFGAAVERLHPDVVLTVGTYGNLLVPLSSLRRPTVLTAHSNTSALVAQSRYGGVLRRLIRWRYAQRTVVCPSAGLADDLQRNFGVSDAVVIPHGVDRQRVWALAEVPATDLPVPPGYIVACGRLTEAKDYPNLLVAYARAREQGLRDPLVIVGGGDEEAGLRMRAGELGVDRHVHFLGHRDNPYPYMKAAKLLVLSSAWEGFGLVLVEAMTLGVPLLATDCPSGPGEILGGGTFGRLVPPRDPAALGDALLELANSPQQLASFAALSVQRSREYGIESMARRYRDLFYAVLAARVRGLARPRSPLDYTG